MNLFYPRYLKPFRIFLFIIIATAFSLLTSHQAQLTSSQKKNICTIFKKYPNWYKYAKISEKKWGTPIYIQMAIINQESNFIATAKSANKKVFDLSIPFTHQSSAYGYAQALNASWDSYKKSTKNPYAKRDNMQYATDFVAWFIYRARKYLHLSNSNFHIDNLYLAYHEGINGYRKKYYLQRRGLISVSKKVAKLANIYKKQLQLCKKT